MTTHPAVTLLADRGLPGARVLRDGFPLEATGVLEGGLRWYMRHRTEVSLVGVGATLEAASNDAYDGFYVHDRWRDGDAGWPELIDWAAPLVYELAKSAN